MSCKKKSVEKKKDIVLVKKIQELIDDKKRNWIQRMDGLLDYLKRERGLKGFHLSIDPFADIKSTFESRESIAKEFIMMELECAKGNFEDCTEELL